MKFDKADIRSVLEVLCNEQIWLTLQKDKNWIEAATSLDAMLAAYSAEPVAPLELVGPATLRRAAKALGSGFVWGEHRLGSEFWLARFRELRSMAETKEMQS